MKTLLLFVTLSLMPALCLSAQVSAYPDNIAVSITPMQSKFDSSAAILIKVTFTNTSAENIRFLVWGTPFEGRINNDFFEVRLDNGSLLPYIGRVYKRGKPNESDFRSIAGNQSIETVVNLYDGYDVSVAGNYTIRYTDKSKNSKTDNTQTQQPEIASFSVVNTGVYRSLKQTPNFNNCSVSEQAIVDLALTEAEELSKIARDDLESTPAILGEEAQRFIEWFGAYSPSRYAFVLDNFKDIYSAIQKYPMEFDCGCNESAFAYVYPYDPFGIFLCNAFWDAPVTGVNSQAGTIIHEISHFDITASTSDHAYGQNDVQNLAVNSPYLAIENADSYEYFAENKPFLIMPITIGEAVDNTEIGWERGGDQVFYGQKNSGMEDGDAAQSGAISHDQVSYLRITLPKASKIDFYWRTSSEKNHDYLEFWINDELKAAISGESDWQEKSYTVSAYDTVEWRYTKDSNVSTGNDAGWIDNVVVEEVQVQAQPQALNLNSPIIQLLLNRNR